LPWSKGRCRRRGQRGIGSGSARLPVLRRTTRAGRRRRRDLPEQTLRFLFREMHGIDRAGNTEPDHDEQTDSGDDQKRAQAIPTLRCNRGQGRRRADVRKGRGRRRCYRRWRRRSYRRLGCAADGAESSTGRTWCAAFRAIAHRCLLTRELHTAVAGTSFERVVGLYGTRGTVAIIGKTIRGDVITRDQSLFHRGGTTFGKV
jgi:hypothetical protein